MKEEEVIKPVEVVCCGVLEKMDIKWMRLADGDKCMPYIESNCDIDWYRVNNCPSCGKYVRDIIIENK